MQAYDPHHQPKVGNTTPDSVLEELHRRFTKWQKVPKYWDLQAEGERTDTEYLKLLKAEIARREKSPEATTETKRARARYKPARENLDDSVPLHALQMKRRDLLLRKRYYPEGYGEDEQEYMRQLKRLIKLLRYRKTMRQREKPYDASVRTPMDEEAEDEAEPEPAPEPVRRSGRARKQTEVYEAGSGAGLDHKKKKATAGVDDDDDDEEGTTRTAPAGYTGRRLMEDKVADDADDVVAEDDDDDAAILPDVPEAERHSESGMSDQQLERLTDLYYGKGDAPPMVVNAKSLYRILLEQGDPPSVRQIQAWLGEQQINQTFKPFYAKGSSVSPFNATKPLRNLAMDLFTATAYGQKQANPQGRAAKYWDGWGKKGGYGLVVIDEYSRWIYTAPLANKEPATVERALVKILDRVKEMNGDKQIHTIRSDDGSEFTGPVAALLKERGIRNIRTLGSAPQSNGQAERAVSSIRRKMALQYSITGKSWRQLLPMATRVHNTTLNKTTGLTPREAVEDSTKAAYQELRTNQYESQTSRRTDPRPALKEGTLVKLRTAPGSMNKTSKQSFYDNVLKIKRVQKPSNPSRAVRYELEDAEGRQQSSGVLTQKLYPRNYLQVVGAPDQTAEKVRARSNINLLKKGRWMRTVG